MATLPPVVSDLESWTGQTISPDDLRADAVLSAATALVRGYAGLAWDDDSVPDEVHAVVVQIASRIWFNPQGLTSETIDDYTRRYGESVESAGLALTDSERVILGRYRTTGSGLWVQPITSGTVEIPLDDLFLRDLDHGDASGTYTPAP